jgi:hypothetical protein
MVLLVLLLLLRHGAVEQQGGQGTVTLAAAAAAVGHMLVGKQLDGRVYAHFCKSELVFLFLGQRAIHVYKL